MTGLRCGVFKLPLVFSREPEGRYASGLGSSFLLLPGSSDCVGRASSNRALGSLEFLKLLLEKALVAVSPGIGFGPLGEGHVRFALIENDQRTRQAIRSIKQFLRE